VKFAASKFDATVPSGAAAQDPERRLIAELEQLLRAYERNLDEMSFRKAMTSLRAMWTAGNVYLAEQEPWKLLATDRARAETVVRTSLNLVRLFAVLSHPIIPDTSRVILDALATSDEERQWPADLPREILRLEPGRRVGSLDLLFRRIADEDVAAWTARFSGSSPEQTVQA
jgi:methionyl-tRNA synthetase